MSKLNNKVAVVTGGNSGIGLATAKRFAAEGAKVIITGRRKEAVEDAVTEIGSGAEGIVADAASLQDTDRMIKQIQKDHGRIDVLVVNAGIMPFGNLAQTDEATYDRIMDVNAKGVFFTLQKAMPLLNKGASVILNASVAHKAGFAGATAYAASKAAVRSIGQSAAAELGPQGIRVNILSPGPIETPLATKTGMPQEALEAVVGQMTATIPLGRFGAAEEMANVALFLASDESSYINGSDIQADGGWTQVSPG